VCVAFCEEVIGWEPCMYVVGCGDVACGQCQ
jgi:hypothetical protein